MVMVRKGWNETRFHIGLIQIWTVELIAYS